jgi:hypothetical protein
MLPATSLGLHPSAAVPLSYWYRKISTLWYCIIRPKWLSASLKLDIHTSVVMEAERSSQRKNVASTNLSYEHLVNIFTQDITESKLLYGYARFESLQKLLERKRFPQ